MNDLYEPPSSLGQKRWTCTDLLHCLVTGVQEALHRYAEWVSSASLSSWGLLVFFFFMLWSVLCSLPLPERWALSGRSAASSSLWQRSTLLKFGDLSRMGTLRGGVLLVHRLRTKMFPDLVRERSFSRFMFSRVPRVLSPSLSLSVFARS